MSADLKSVPASGSATEEMMLAGANSVLLMLRREGFDDLSPPQQAILIAQAAYQAMVVAAPDLQ